MCPSFLHIAQDWSADPNALIWKGRLRIIESSSSESTSQASVEIRLEDSDSGELFASAPYDADGKAVEPVLDSSRYFVLRVVDPGSGNKAFLGMGFIERTDAFDFNVALQESTRRRQPSLAPTSKAAAPSKDFSLKEGETISISIGGKKAGSGEKKPASSGFGGMTGFLPPPPSANQVRRGL